jgi:DNA-binding transcriptional regulator YhcF (GntR family)
LADDHEGGPVTIDPDSPELRYVQVARLLRDAIISGEIPLGGLMPTEKKMTEQFGINRATAQTALELLRKEGLIITRHGIGSHVAAVPQVERVTLRPGDEIRARMPDERERTELGIGPGIPVLVVTRARGGGEETYGAATAICRCENQDKDASLLLALGLGQSWLRPGPFRPGIG